MELRLFLLGTTLFPGAVLPLHVFEERYKQMINECLSEKSPFGVVLIRQGTEVGDSADAFEVGTTAYITQVQRLDDGRMNLLTSGRERFRILEMLRSAPYASAQVEILESVNDVVGDALGEDVRSLFIDYSRLYLAVSGQWARTVSTPPNPETLSDFVAAQLAVGQRQKQRLLETLSVKSRLQAEASLLEEATRQLRPQVRTALAQKWGSSATLN